MNTETSEVIERINARIGALEVSLRAEIRAESATVRDELRGEIRAESKALRAEIREGLAETRRHAEVLHESSRDDIHMLEAFASMSVKLDSLQR